MRAFKDLAQYRAAIIEGKELSPEPGMGATLVVGSDSYPYTITHVFSDRKIAVRSDERAEDGLHEIARGPKRIYTKRKDGSWCQAGSARRYTGKIIIGIRLDYRDPSF